MNLRMGSVKLYAIAERERERHSTLTITLKRVGFISGSMQVIGGFGLCKASLGAACKSYGVPLMMQEVRMFGKMVIIYYIMKTPKECL